VTLADVCVVQSSANCLFPVYCCITNSKGSVVVNFLLVLKRYRTATEVTDVLKKYLKSHNNLLGLFVVNPDSVTFSGI